MVTRRRRRYALSVDPLGGSIRFAGREHRIVEPRIVDLATAGAHLPLPIRFVSRRLGLRHWVTVRRLSS